VTGASENMPFMPPPPIDAQLGTTHIAQAAIVAMAEASFRSSIRMTAISLLRRA
jgi:hypothetical protein